MEENNLLLNVRDQYTQKLQDALAIGLYEGLKQMWDMAKQTAHSGEVYREFQNNLKNVKKWNTNIVQGEHKRIISRSKCEWIDDLIKQVFKLNTQYLASVDSRTALMRIKVSIPDTPTFIHECYVNVARKFWLNVPLLEDRSMKITKIAELGNYELALSLIKDAILNTVMENVPMKELAQESLQPHSDSEADDSADDNDRHYGILDDGDDKYNNDAGDGDDGNGIDDDSADYSRRSPAQPVTPSRTYRMSPESEAVPSMGSKPGSLKYTNTPPPSRTSSMRSLNDPSRTFSESLFENRPSSSGPSSRPSSKPSSRPSSRPSSKPSSRPSSSRPSPSRSSPSSDATRLTPPVKPDLETVEEMNERRKRTPSPSTPPAADREHPDDEMHFFSDADSQA